MTRVEADIMTTFLTMASMISNFLYGIKFFSSDRYVNTRSLPAHVKIEDAYGYLGVVIGKVATTSGLETY